MSERIFSLPSENIEGRTDHFIVGRMNDLANYYADPKNRFQTLSKNFHGTNDSNEVVSALRYGSTDYANRSDEWLDAMEKNLPEPTAKRQTVHDVAGGVPNIGAYMANQPLNMVRRAPVADEKGPLAIVVDTTSSAVVSTKALEKRGAAILALVRAISARRPVQLYAGSWLDARKGGNADSIMQLYEIDTAPLDLARAAVLLAHPAANRAAQHDRCFKHYGFTGLWPYGNNKNTIGNSKCFADTARRALPQVEDCFAVPAIFSNNDASTVDPVKWVRDNAASLIGDETHMLAAS